jgi:hypothetical protein
MIRRRWRRTRRKRMRRYAQLLLSLCPYPGNFPDVVESLVKSE